MQLARRPVVGLVEDSDEDSALFERVFRADWEVRRWSSGEAALLELRGDDQRLTELAVLVVDLKLGGIGGTEVVRRVRELPGGRAAKVCLFTSSRLEGDRREGIDVGADAFLVKPADAAQLRQLPALLARLADDG